MTVLLERSIPRTPQQPRRNVTWEEYLALPEGPPYYEFEDGELIMMTRPHGRHQKILMRLVGVLDTHIVADGLGSIWMEIVVQFPHHARGYIPDLVYLVSEHLDRFWERDGRIHGTPDLVVEILSPSTRRRDRTQKMQVYQQAGVPWYWLVEQDDLTIEEFELTARGYLANQLIPPGVPFQPTLFPGLTIDLAALMGETVTDLDAVESEEIDQ